MTTTPGNAWRVFCAIELAKTTRQLVLRHIAALQQAVPDAHASWAREANLHLTLKFLGEIPQPSVEHFSTAAARAVAGLTPFSIGLEHTGAFPKHGQPRVLWIGINDPTGELGELYARLEEESAHAGFARGTRPFHPHLTVARLRKPLQARKLAAAHKQLEFELVKIAVSELLVIRSELSGEGSKYTVVSRHAFDLPTANLKDL
jgi:RNA 2',3'-cyclic 3'-phosphodiesterase